MQERSVNRAVSQPTVNSDWAVNSVSRCKKLGQLTILVNCPSCSDRPINLETERMNGCCGHVTTAQTRGLFIFTLATMALSKGYSTRTAREQCYADLQKPIGDKAWLIRAVRHFLIIVDELMNETKWIL